MLKNKVWIVALIAALAMVFFGCTNMGVDPDAPKEEYEKIPLGEPGFNTVAGMPASQKGWATDGYKDSDNPTAAADGYKLADFLAASHFVIETAKNAEGGLSFVWQAKNFPDNNWNTQKFAALADSSSPNKGVTKEANKLGGQTIKIELAAVMGSTYGAFLESEDYVRFVIAYYSPDLSALDVKEAYLLKPLKEPPPVPADLTGLDPAFGLGQTTIRKSGNEYGWQFTKKGTDGKVPAGYADIATLREADYFFFVSKGGGLKAPNGDLIGYEQLSVIIQAEGEEGVETALYKDEIGFEHTSGDSVYFVIELATLIDYAKTIGATWTAKDIEDKKAPTGAKAGDPKYDSINLTLKYASRLENLGLVAGYLYKDSDDDDDGELDLAFYIDDLYNGQYTPTPTTLEYKWHSFEEEYGSITKDSGFKILMASKNIALPMIFPDMEEKKGALGDFTAKSSDSQFIWGFGGVDGALDWDLLAKAKYLVLETKGSSSTDGFGGIRLVYQGPTDNWNWNDFNPWGDTLSFAHTASDTVYIVFDLTTLPWWSKVTAEDAVEKKGKIVIQYWDLIDLGLTDGYLIPATSATAFAKATFSDAVDAAASTAGAPVYGYVTKAANFTTALNTLYGR